MVNVIRVRQSTLSSLCITNRLSSSDIITVSSVCVLVNLPRTILHHANRAALVGDQSKVVQ